MKRTSVLIYADGRIRTDLHVVGNWFLTYEPTLTPNGCPTPAYFELVGSTQESGAGVSVYLQRSEREWKDRGRRATPSGVKAVRP